MSGGLTIEEFLYQMHWILVSMMLQLNPHFLVPTYSSLIIIFFKGNMYQISFSYLNFPPLIYFLNIKNLIKE